ncbi:MAG: GMC family oxidoreductase [Myxococcota bacterium]|nr:GMC family oxidoreductase [Myxococcota bacterium]
MRGQLFIGEDITQDHDVQCDVCIVGSGAGGAVLAAGLVSSGLKVVMLEEGGYYDQDNFKLNEGDAYFNLYQDRGTRATSDVSITVLQGRTVGGSTTVNWTTCFRTPDRILKHWEQNFGTEAITTETLKPHFEEVERRLGIQEWPLDRVNANNKVLVDGCKKLGYEVRPLRRNVRSCADSGFCGMGCPIGAKQAMHRTYIQDALDLGLTIYSDVRAERFIIENNKTTSVVGQVLDRETSKAKGRQIQVRAKVFVSSCGAINGPALFLRSGITAEGRIGRRTMLHPVVGVTAVYENPIHPYYGAPQSAGSHEFVDRGANKIGYFLESAPLHPSLASLGGSAFGSLQGELLQNLSHTGVLLALSVDGLHPNSQGGTVRLRNDGRIKFDYPMCPELLESFKDAHQTMARISFAAGAKKVGTAHVEPVILSSDKDLKVLQQVEYGAFKHGIFSAHQMGGCMMGSDPKNSVVDTDLRMHDLQNTFVVDGSVLPTALGVNPSQTIYGLAHRAVKKVAESV